MILDLHRQGLSTIARRTGRDPKTVRKYIERGLEPPAYGPRQPGRPSKLAPTSIICMSGSANRRERPINRGGLAGAAWPAGE
jgi:transposase